MDSNGTPLQYFCLENPVDGGAWWAVVHGVARVGRNWATSLSLSCIREGNGNPLQCSCLENPRDGEAWWAAICGVAQSRTWLKRLSSNLAVTWTVPAGVCTYCRTAKTTEPLLSSSPTNKNLWVGRIGEKSFAELYTWLLQGRKTTSLL